MLPRVYLEQPFAESLHTRPHEKSLLRGYSNCTFFFSTAAATSQPNELLKAEIASTTFV